MPRTDPGTALATAQDIPPELFDTILDYIGTLDYGHLQYYVNAGFRTDTGPESDLADCSLVCLHWASRCRPRLFSSLILRTRQHMRTLTDLARFNWHTRVPPMSRYVRKIALDVGWDDRSWVHHVYPLIKLMGAHVKLTGLCLANPRTEVPLKENCVARGSMYATLPRSLPSCYYTFTTLEVNDTHFAQLSCLDRLIAELPLLVRVALVSVSWDDNQPLPVGRARAPAPGYCSAAAMNIFTLGCTDDAQLALRAASCLVHAHARRPGRVRPNAAPHVYPLVPADSLGIYDLFVRLCAPRPQTAADNSLSQRPSHDHTITSNIWGQEHESKNGCEFPAFESLVAGH